METQHPPHPELKPGARVASADGQAVGEILEVFRNVGDMETFGAAGIPPQQEGFAPEQYAYSEAMPGAGDDYFTVRQPDGTILYVAFSHVSSVEDGQVRLAVDAENLADMNWTVRPDALAGLAHEYEQDTGADPKVA